VPWVSVQNAGFSATADLSGLGGAVAPGMIAAIYGNQLGPDTGVSATVDSNGTVGSNLAGVQVFFNGIAAPVLYAQSGQINVVAPYEIAGTNTVQVYTEYNGLRSNVNTLPVLPRFRGCSPSRSTRWRRSTRAAPLTRARIPRQWDRWSRCSPPEAG